MLLYADEIESIFSNDKKIPLHTTVSLKRKRTRTENDYQSKISSKSYLSKHSLNKINVYATTESGDYLYQVNKVGIISIIGIPVYLFEI